MAILSAQVLDKSETFKHLLPHETTITEYICPNADGVVPLFQHISEAPYFNIKASTLRLSKHRGPETPTPCASQHYHIKGFE